mgnify:CR=1 FL=1
MKIADIAGYLETLAPLSLREDYDNCGLLAGDPDGEVTSAMVCLDATEAIIGEAIHRGCNLVISHHPLIFKGLKRLTPGQPGVGALLRAVRHGVALYAMHTNLDNSLEGLNKHVMTRLGAGGCRILKPLAAGLLKLAVFCPHDRAEEVRLAMFTAGAGRIGNYDACSFNLRGEGTFRAGDAARPYVGAIGEMHAEPETRIEVIVPRSLERKVVAAMIRAHPYEEVAYDLYPLQNADPTTGAGVIGNLHREMERAEFLQWVRESLSLQIIRHTGGGPAKISRVALCTGSGAFLVQEAERAGADAYLTADLKYHDFTDSPERMLLADIGHFESEIWVKEWLHARLIEKFPNFAVLLPESETNPVNYF